MALQPGRGRTAVPVRSAIFGATLGVAAAHRLAGVRRQPRPPAGHAPAVGVHLGRLRVGRRPARESGRGAAARSEDRRLHPRGLHQRTHRRRVKLMALVLGGPGPARPVITAGVAPAAGDEVALGASTMREAHTAIGRTVDLVSTRPKGTPEPVRMRVVGTAIIPPNPYLATGLGEGAAVTMPGLSADRSGRRPAAGQRCHSWCASPPASAATPGSPPSPMTSRACRARASSPPSGPRTWSAWRASRICRSLFPGCWP